MPFTMTERLYYQEPERLEFEAAVVKTTPLSDGGREYVLDRTCFYPGGGGQPSDRGTLGGEQVLDVREEENGDIVHVLERPAKGDRLAGAVDAARRRDYMAQHTGEHLLAQALLRAGGLHTVSVHFGDDDATIEVKADSVEERVLQAAEEIANGAIRENRRIVIHEIDRSEAGKFPLRRTPPEAEQRLRIVEVEGFDWVGCSGVHVRTTGDVFLIKVVSQEKIRGRARLHVLIGNRAFRDYGRKVALSQALGRMLTCGEDTILARVQDLQAAQLEAARELKRLRTVQAGADADTAASAGRRIGEVVLVRRTFTDAGADYLKAFAERVVDAPGRIVIAMDRSPASFQWIVAHSVGDGLELSGIVPRHFSAAEAKGGGKGNRMQGVGTRADGLEAFADGIEADLARALGKETA